MPTAAGFTACQTSTYGWPVTSTCGSRTPATIAALLAARHEVVDQHARAGATGRCRTPAPRAGRSSTPSSGSTTTPSTRRSCPQTRSTSSASCVPSTQMRLPLATCARSPCTATDPEADRFGPAAAARAHRAGQRHGDALEQEGGRLEREDPDLAVPVLERDALLVALDDGAAPAGRDLLDDQSRLGRHGLDDPPGRTGGDHGRVVGRLRTAGHARPARRRSGARRSSGRVPSTSAVRHRPLRGRAVVGAEVDGGASTGVS